MSANGHFNDLHLHLIVMHNEYCREVNCTLFDTFANHSALTGHFALIIVLLIKNWCYLSTFTRSNGYCASYILMDLTKRIEVDNRCK